MLQPEDAFDQFDNQFDKQYGGFGRAQKFPTPHNLLFFCCATGSELANEGAGYGREDSAGDARGGMYDHVGFAFIVIRRTTWHVPHF